LQNENSNYSSNLQSAIRYNILSSRIASKFRAAGSEQS
jgi:hypothetical protein